MKTGYVESTTYTTQAAQYSGDAAPAATVTVEAERENTDKVAINWKEWSEQQKKQAEFLIPTTSEVEAKFKMSNSKPSDSSVQLTRRLAAASTDFEIQSVIAKAGSSMVSLRLIASIGEGDDKKKAKEYLRKLEKLMDRASGKLKDLRNEAGLEQQRNRAEKQKQERRTEEIKAELRKRRRDRHNRENSWLREAANDSLMTAASPGRAKDDPADRLDAASEAEIAMEAEAIATAETAAAGGDVSAGGGEISTGGGGEAAVSGGEAAAPEAGASVDITV